MEYLIIENGIISNIIICDNDENAKKFGAIPSYEGAKIGDEYRPPKPVSSELREEAYNTEKVIEWSGDMITVTEASQLWQYYAAEGSGKATELQSLIAKAKATIRDKYPDISK